MAPGRRNGDQLRTTGGGRPRPAGPGCAGGARRAGGRAGLPRCGRDGRGERPSDAAFGRGLLQLLIVGGPIAVGLYALREPVNKSFGVALLGIGFAWSLTALAESSPSVPHTIGRLATWLIFPCVVYLLLAFPHGRIEQGLDRAVFVGVVGRLAVAVLRHRAVRAGVSAEDVVVDLHDRLPGERAVRPRRAAGVPDAGRPRPRMADRAAVARLVLLDVPPLACGLAAAAARDRSGVRRRDAARPCSTARTSRRVSSARRPTR